MTVRGGRYSIVKAVQLRATGDPKGTKVLIAASAVAFCLLAAGGSSAAASGNPASASRARLQAALDSIVTAGVPGALVLVRDGNHTVRLASGYGNVARRTPMRVTDRFRIGSDTKTFVATVVLKLVGERKLGLDETVERRLPGLVPNGRKITVRQLLNHTSGLYDYAEDKAFLAQFENRTKVWSPRALVEIALKHEPLFPPGRRWSYSNTGYTLLGMMVERATGNKLGTELRKRIFEPLGLRGTSFDTKPRIAGRHSHGYTMGQGKVRYDISVFNPSLFGAAGAIVSTASDLARFHRARVRGRLLRPDLLAAMHTTVRVTPQQHYGLGVIRTRYPCGTFWGHGGETFGYQTFTETSGNGKRQVVIAMNADETTRTPRADDAAQRLRVIALCG
jgi:D-alanyl-D-alanine carboxypeptidase